MLHHMCTPKPEGVAAGVIAVPSASWRQYPGRR